MDPFANLRKRYLARSDDYLRSLAQLPGSNGLARERHYILGSQPAGPYSWADIDAADDRSYNQQSVWTDDPVAQWMPADIFNAEDVQPCIARLRTLQGQSFTPPFPQQPELLPLDEMHSFREVSHLAQIFGVAGRYGYFGILRRVRDQLQAVTNIEDGSRTYDDDLINRVRDSLNGPLETATEHPVDKSTIVKRLTGYSYTVSQNDSETLITADVAQWTADGLFALFPSDIAGAIVTNAVPIDVPLGATKALISADAWAAISFFADFGNYETRTVWEALLDFAQTMNGPSPAPRPGIDDGVSIFQALIGDRVYFGNRDSSHDDGIDWRKFVSWPDYTVEGMYWWRAILLPHCLVQLFILNDTADFHATYLLRFVHLFKIFDTPQPSPQVVPQFVIDTIRAAFLHFKFWLDWKPTPNKNGEMTFWSENHQILFASSAVLVFDLFPNEQFVRSASAQNTGSALRAEALNRAQGWLLHRLSYGFAEWNAPGYYNEDLPAILNLADFCTDLTTQTLAAMVLDLMYFDFGRLTCHGSFGVTAGRAYWEHKCYGWEQSIGETIQILFGTRGDFMGGEPAAVGLATVVQYEVPDAILAIGLDRVLIDSPQSPMIDRSRVSIALDESGWDIPQFQKEADIIFWWGLAGYFTKQTLDGTRSVVAAHPRLSDTAPFSVLSILDDDQFHQVLYDGLETAAGAILAAGGSGAFSLAPLLPFPFNFAVGAAGFTAELGGIGAALEGIIHILGDVLAVIGKGIKAIGKALGLGGDDDSPKIPESALEQALDALLIQFNAGSLLTRANIYTYGNGDVMLSSVQSHLPGALAAQKQPWLAALDLTACVWTNAPLSGPSDAGAAIGEAFSAWLEFFKDLGTLKPIPALIDLVRPVVGAENKDAGITGVFGHDGPNYWTGSLGLPMIAQFENAAIIAYNLTNAQRAEGDAATHAWFPKWAFDQNPAPEVIDQSGGGTWVFAHKGNGAIALYSAQRAKFATDGAWIDKELRAEGGANIFVCFVASLTQFDGSYATFKSETLNARLHISGVGSPNGLQCSFDIPRRTMNDQRAPRLELNYDDGTAAFAGDPLTLDEFPRYDNKYVTQNSSSTVAWNQQSYIIEHPQTGLTLSHDYGRMNRAFTSQVDLPIQNMAKQRRLVDGSLTPVRRSVHP